MHRVVLILFLGIPLLALAQEPTFPIKLNKKWGLMNAEGQVVVEPLYDAIGEFKEYGYAVMQQGGQVGMINREGRQVVAPQFDDLRLLDSLRFAVRVEEGWTVIDVHGEYLLKRPYDRVKLLGQGHLGFQDQRRWGIVQIQGPTISTALYDAVEYLEEGYFIVEKTKQKGLIDLNGHPIIPIEAEAIKVYSEDFFLFQKEQHWGARNRAGTLLLDPIYQNLQALGKNFIKLYDKSRVSLFSLAAGRIINDQPYDDFYSFNHRYVLCKKERQLGLIDKEGNMVLPTRYNEILSFGEEQFRVNYRMKWGVVNRQNEVVIPLEYQYIAPPVGFVCLVRKGPYFGVLNTTGELLVPTDYDLIELDARQAKAHSGEALSLFNFDESGKLAEESSFRKHFTITIGGRSNTTSSTNAFSDDDTYLLNDFEWFYSSAEDRWGLRRRDNGNIQIKPVFDWIRIERDLGFTIVGIEKVNYYDFEWT